MNDWKNRAVQADPFSPTQDLEKVLEKYNGGPNKEAYAKAIMDCADKLKNGKVQDVLTAIGRW